MFHTLGPISHLSNLFSPPHCRGRVTPSITWTLLCHKYHCVKGTSWSWLDGSWIYNYLCNQCLSPLKLWVRIPLRRGVLDTTLYDKVCQWLTAGRWFSPGTPISPTNKTDHRDIPQLLLKVALNTITLTLLSSVNGSYLFMFHTLSPISHLPILFSPTYCRGWITPNIA